MSAREFVGRTTHASAATITQILRIRYPPVCVSNPAGNAVNLVGRGQSVKVFPHGTSKGRHIDITGEMNYTIRVHPPHWQEGKASGLPATIAAGLRSRSETETLEEHRL